MKSLTWNAEEVKAYLEGRKVMHTVPLKKQPPTENAHVVVVQGTPVLWGEGTYVGRPPLKVGDTFYVKEAWRVGAWRAGRVPAIAVDYKDPFFVRKEWLEISDKHLLAFGRLVSESAIDAKVGGFPDYVWKKGQGPCRWRAAITMPEWASRIKCEVTGVKVRRVQDITGGEMDRHGWPVRMPVSEEYPDPMYNLLAGVAEWNTRYGKKYPWESSPWVASYTFPKHERAK